MTEFAVQNGEHPSGEATGVLSDSDLAVLPEKNPNQAFIILMRDRPGAGESLMELEEIHYPPDTPANAKFELFVVSRWPKDSFVEWLIAAIPLEDLSKAQEIFKKRRLILKRGYVPILVEPNREDERFPMPGGDNVFSVEGDKFGVAALVQVPNEFFQNPKAKA
jgi:hypothetical protein